ncbi:hypothetical protein [Burkholderia anthina]|uniref:hypothetical protein n=1 Tax=Burkholderia anthina TaxID=179879 RepID=UPI00158ECEAD|nr:hypothetical protein [Burkholderia anthina]
MEQISDRNADRDPWRCSNFLQLRSTGQPPNARHAGSGSAAMRKCAQLQIAHVGHFLIYSETI